MTNGSATNSSTVTLYAPTFSLPYATITADTSLFVTMRSLTDGSYSAIFSGPEYSTSTLQTAASSVWTIAVPDSISSASQLYTLGLSESSNSITSTYTVYSRIALVFTVIPSASVSGGNTVTVSLLNPAYATSIYYSAIMNSSTFASTVLPYTESTWKFIAPTNQNNLISVVVSNSSSSMTSTITDYAPTVSQSNNGIVPGGGQFTLTVSGINTTSPYSITFGNGIYMYTNTISGTSTAFTVPVPANYIGRYTFTLGQAPNQQVLTYTVARPVGAYGLY